MLSAPSVMPMRRWLLALCGALVSAGCGGEADREDVDESAAAGTVATSFRGTYVVPHVDPALAPAATYPVTVKVKELAGGAVRMHYTLPPELVGVPQDVDLVGSASGGMSGPAGRADCRADVDANTECRETLSGVRVDLQQVKAALEARGVTASEQDAKMKVAERFGIDPIGVLRFTGRKKQPGRRHDGR